MRLLEFGLFQIPHLSVCLDGEQSVANASTENQRISTDDGLRRVVVKVIGAKDNACKLNI
jgi:hypothetical protein